MSGLLVNKLKAEQKTFQGELEKLEGEFSVSILSLLEVLRNNRQIEESVNKATEIISKENPKTENVAIRLDSISEAVKS